jgi:hypothetical protein
VSAIARAALIPVLLVAALAIVPAPQAVAEAQAAAAISDGTVTLGVNPEGDLNGAGFGLRYEPTGADALSPGCPCEGWGVGVGDSGEWSGANRNQGVFGLEVESFTATATEATSVVRGSGLRITHRYRPSGVAGVYQIDVTIQNLGSTALSDVRYRRVMDWDVPPTTFHEYISVNSGTATRIRFTSDDGFATVNPLQPNSGILFTGNAEDSGPTDAGALFDLDVGPLAGGQSRSFAAYYGAAASKSAALLRLGQVRAEAYSLGMPSSVSPPDGVPNTFFFGLAGVGGTPIASPGPRGPLHWVVLGDSHSSGTGLGRVTPGCDRDDGAYGPSAYRRLNREGTVRSDVLRFVACIGHTTHDYWSSQDDFVTSEADVVTITIGGNDLDIRGKIVECYILRCGPDIFMVRAKGGSEPVTWDQLFSRLVDVYFDIRTRMDPNGHLYVLSYAIPFAFPESACHRFDPDEQLAANAWATRLGDTIYQAVQAANSAIVRLAGRPGNVHFLDWRTGTRFENGYAVPAGYSNAGERHDVIISPNGLCTRVRGHKEFLNGFVVNRLRVENSFHPNRWGYDYAATVLANAVRSDFADGR